MVMCLLTVSVASANQESLYGKWGTEAQCSGALITPKGTRRASPFKIESSWLEYGDVWCRLNWSIVKETEDGLRATASAVCGEDSVRDYMISFFLKNEALTISWNIQYKNGPLARCD